MQTDAIANELAIRLFFFGGALAVGLEAYKAPRPQSYWLWMLFAVLIAGGLFLSQMQHGWPAVVTALAQLVTAPSSWFMLLVMLFIVGRSYWSTPSLRQPAEIGTTQDDILQIIRENVPVIGPSITAAEVVQIVHANLPAPPDLTSITDRLDRIDGTLARLETLNAMQKSEIDSLAAVADFVIDTQKARLAEMLVERLEAIQKQVEGRTGMYMMPFEGNGGIFREDQRAIGTPFVG